MYVTESPKYRKGKSLCHKGKFEIQKGRIRKEHTKILSKFFAFFTGIKIPSCDLHKKEQDDSGESHRLCGLY